MSIQLLRYYRYHCIVQIKITFFVRLCSLKAKMIGRIIIFYITHRIYAILTHLNNIHISLKAMFLIEIQSFRQFTEPHSTRLSAFLILIFTSLFQFPLTNSKYSNIMPSANDIKVAHRCEFKRIFHPRRT